MTGKQESELTVVTKAKELCSYVMLITQKSPKHFRFTFVTRMQNLAFEQGCILAKQYEQISFLPSSISQGDSENGYP